MNASKKRVTFQDEDKNDKVLGLLEDIFIYFRMGSLLLIWIFCLLSFIFGIESKKVNCMVAVSATRPYEFLLTGDMQPGSEVYGVVLVGPLINDASLHKEHGRGRLEIKFESIEPDKSHLVPVRNVFSVEVSQDESGKHKEVVKRAFELDRLDSDYKFSITAIDLQTPVAFQLQMIPNMIAADKSIVIGIILLLLLYVLIIWDIVDRVFAALLSAMVGIAVLSLLQEKPTIDKIMSWIDLPTMILLFGMMILVAILADTGVFDVVAVLAYRLSRGHSWPMIYIVCLVTGILSAFLDNVTMMLLMAPVTIRLCEVMKLNVINVLIVVVVFSNIGGAATPVGDPPNIIISNNNYVKADGINFLVFTVHIFPAILLCLAVTIFQARFSLGNEGIKSPPNTEQKPAQKEMDREQTQAMNEKIETLKKKNKGLEDKQVLGLKPTPSFVQTLSEMEARYPIKNKALLIKSGVALGFAICMFCLQSVPACRGMSLEWAALLAALLLLIISSTDDISSVLERVEWPTLLFFAALFVVMECMGELGVIEWLGLQTISVINSVSDRNRLGVAILIFVWVTGIASAFVDSIPITQMMLKVCVHIYGNDSLNLPLSPLVWSLVLGSCLGANGTLIGSTSNVVCAGIAAHHGYKITFYEYFKIGFPITLTTLTIATIYLQICHVAMKWH